MNTLKAEKRSMSDKAKKLRREGYVTGNVFGRSIAESIPVQIEKKEAEKFLSVCHLVKHSEHIGHIKGSFLHKDLLF